jgi:hypothetical protein
MKGGAVLHRPTTEIINATTNTQEMEMVLLASAYDQSKFLKAADLSAEKKFRIKSVTEEEVGIGRDKERKLVVWFTNDARGLVLNRVNNRTIRGAFGDTCESWTGKIIIAFPTMAEFRGEMKPALRVRIPPPKGNGQPAAVATTPPKSLADDLDIPASLKRTPKNAQPATPPDELADMIDDDLNDEVNI